MFFLRLTYIIYLYTLFPVFLLCGYFARLNRIVLHTLALIITMMSTREDEDYAHNPLDVAINELADGMADNADFTGIRLKSSRYILKRSAAIFIE